MASQIAREDETMSALSSQECVPCHAGEPTLTDAEIAELAPQTPEWSNIERDGERRLERAFQFQDFASALSFAIAIGAAAEEQGHHPALLVEWGKVTVTWWTHTIGGLHRNDFIMAARTDALYEQAAGRKA
jgi:4a-hydroxytetrahydrobiopterin dehydratase